MRDRKTSGTGPHTHTHTRTLSNALSFSDLAQHGNVLVANRIFCSSRSYISTGRKQLNQFITRLDKEGSMRGGNVDLAARSARAMQDVERAGGPLRPESFLR
jgi:hypothetical protein